MKASKPKRGLNMPPNEVANIKEEVQSPHEFRTLAKGRGCSDKKFLGMLSALDSDDEENLEELTYAELEEQEKRDMLSTLDSDDEVNLDKLTYAELEEQEKRDMLSALDSDDEVNLDKLTYAELEEQEKRDMLSALDSDDEVNLDKLTYAELEEQEKRDIGGTGPKVTNDGTKPSGDTQENDKRKQPRPDGLHSPNLLLARKIIRKHRLKRMSKDEAGLWRSNGRSYEPLTREGLEAIVYEEIPYETKIRLDSCTALKRNVTDYIYDEMALMAKEGNREYYFDSSDYERIRGRVVLQNGVYNIAEDVLEEFDPDSPYYYELNAEYLECNDELLGTPTFDKVISDACEGDKESIRTILQGLGVLLIPDKVKKIIVLGPASNSGKSVLCGRFLETVLPRNRIQHISPAALKGKFALGNAENAVLISCMDVDMEDISPAASGAIKRATGEDVISAEKKHQNAKDIFVRFKFVFGTNGSFCTRQYDAGWLNRLLVLPFIHELSDEEIDMRVPEKLVAEKDAIVTKLLRAVGEVLMPDGSIMLYESPVSRELKLKWSTQNSYFEDFIREVVELTGDDLDNYSSEEVYDAYSRFYISQARQDKEYKNRYKLTKTEVISNLVKCGGGLVGKKRMGRKRDGKFKNAQHRICGLHLRSPDIFGNNDRTELEA